MLSEKQLKENAIKHLEQIGSYRPYTNAFKKGTITMYEGYGGYYIDNEEELKAKIKEVENNYNGKVYAVIHSMTTFGEMYSMLWASGYEEDSEYDVEDYGHGTYAVMAYVWNKTYDDCSEFGTIMVKPALGGLLRVD